jgi:hypothetical protein
MLFTSAMFVGIGPTTSRRPLQYAIINEDLEIQGIDSGDMETVLAIIASLDSPLVAIGAPQGPNRDLLKSPEVRKRYNLRAEGRTWTKWRVCEYELRRRNIRVYNTPDRREIAPKWVQSGFALYRRLMGMGFRFLDPNEPLQPRQLLEVQPHASYTVLLERRPFLRNTLEGRLQRQLVLYLEGADVPNPILTLEEITRHHLLSGHLPLEGLHNPEELDALVSAFTAYLVMKRPDRISYVGEHEEGLITLPAAEIKAFYP